MLNEKNIWLEHYNLNRLKLDNIARFIKEKIENLISVENKKISAVVEMLVERKYDRDPEKVWREEAKKKVKL